MNPKNLVMAVGVIALVPSAIGFIGRTVPEQGHWTDLGDVTQTAGGALGGAAHEICTALFESCREGRSTSAFDGNSGASRSPQQPNSPFDRARRWFGGDRIDPPENYHGVPNPGNRMYELPSEQDVNRFGSDLAPTAPQDFNDNGWVELEELQ